MMERRLKRFHRFLRRRVCGLCLAVLVIPLLASCIGAPAASIPFIPLDRTATRPASATDSLGQAIESVTQTAAAPPVPSITHTPQPSLTPTPYMGIDFSQVELFQGGFLSELRYFVSFRFPEEVRGEYRAVVDRNKDYNCVVLPDYRDRLYCSGPLVAVENWADIDLYAGDGQQPVWSGEFYVPEMD